MEVFDIPQKKIRVAVVGCVHDELERVYETCLESEKKTGLKIDLVLCCGDFESIRNEQDLACMACPPKYRTMANFWKYYAGLKTAPYLTIFVHGNHEASNYIMELPYGGWMAPNIYFMGFAGVVNFGGLRIAGFGGIYNHRNFYKGRHETCPLNEDTKRSIYHCREYEMYQLMQLQSPIDIMLSHDWPRNAVDGGDTNFLFKKKKDFLPDYQLGQLGNPAHDQVMVKTQPLYWFSAHMHIRYPATIIHSDETNTTAPENPNNNNQPQTSFLALDKALPRRQFIEIVEFEVESEAPNILSYDPEWLSIIQQTQDIYPRSHSPIPARQKRDKIINLDIVCQLNAQFGDLTINPDSFVRTAKAYFGGSYNKLASTPPFVINPQTVSLCRRLNIKVPCFDGTKPWYNDQSDIDYQLDELRRHTIIYDQEVSDFQNQQSPSTNPSHLNPNPIRTKSFHAKCGISHEYDHGYEDVSSINPELANPSNTPHPPHNSSDYQHPTTLNTLDNMSNKEYSDLDTRPRIHFSTSMNESQIVDHVENNDMVMDKDCTSAKDQMGDELGDDDGTVDIIW